MGGTELIFVLVVVLGGLYAMGYLPTAGLVGAYKRIRLMLLLWAVAIILIGAVRLFDVA